MRTNEATLAPTTRGPSERPNRTGAEPRLLGQAPLAFKPPWHASPRRYAHMTNRALAAMPTVADAREVA